MKSLTWALPPRSIVFTFTASYQFVGDTVVVVDICPPGEGKSSPLITVGMNFTVFICGESATAMIGTAITTAIEPMTMARPYCEVLMKSLSAL